ncbi:MAG TPA: ABC transporter permease [Ktedonobacteraceae bacterium]|nr:ABC transporter permease [Ktedonobacteraceae bacterium]
MRDILTMVWKEAKDLLFQGGWRSLIRPLFVIGIMGIYLPLQFGSQWVDLAPLGMILLLWIPFFVVISFIGDAIAGERERHTLETLLASRMPDRAILLGKIVATVLYAWGMGVLSLLLGLLLVDLLRTQGHWMFYPLDLFVIALVLILLASVLATSAGVLVSLRASTVRQAQQILSIGTIVFVFGSVFVLRAIPANVLSSLTYSQFLLIVMAVLAALDAILLGLSLASFQRSRLILS